MEGVGGVIVVFLRFILANDGLFDEQGGGQGKQSNARVKKTALRKAH